MLDAGDPTSTYTLVAIDVISRIMVPVTDAREVSAAFAGIEPTHIGGEEYFLVHSLIHHLTVYGLAKEGGQMVTLAVFTPNNGDGKWSSEFSNVCLFTRNPLRTSALHPPRRRTPMHSFLSNCGDS